METHIGPATDKIINLIVKEVSKKKNKDKILKYVIEPILYDITRKYYYHFIMIISILLVIIALLIVIIIVK